MTNKDIHDRLTSALLRSRRIFEKPGREQPAAAYGFLETAVKQLSDEIRPPQPTRIREAAGGVS